MNKHYRMSIALLTLLLFTSATHAQQSFRTEYLTLGVEQVASGLEHPWSLAVLSDGSMLVTERGGTLNFVTQEGDIQPINGTPVVSAINQGGLLEVLPHPDFQDNRILYLTYSKEDPTTPGQTATALARGYLINGELIAVEDLFIQDRYSAPGRHYGSKLAWLPDNTLLMSIGDRGREPPRAQDPNDHAGKLLRLTQLGQAPKDNPFVDQPNAKPEVFSLGNRNIQGLMVDPDTGEIWATEHGPRGGDELNLIRPGANYGWPVVSLGRDYRTEEQFAEGRRSHPDMIDPMIDWTPGIAPSGLVKLDHESWGRWQGNFLAGGLRTEQLRRIVFENGVVVHQEEILRGELGRIRDVRTGPDGHVYVITDAAEGAIFKIYPLN